MKDIDHKLSREIINTAKAHDVSVIKLERLQNICSTTRTSRKNNHSLHTWSFYRLAQFIEYKAKLAGIKVEYVDPSYTSQICPICGSVHHANDRNYICRCGFHTHRDLLGAINICNSTEYIGNRYTAQRTIGSALGRVMAYPYLALRPIRNELVSQQCQQVARIPCLQTWGVSKQEYLVNVVCQNVIKILNFIIQILLKQYMKSRLFIKVCFLNYIFLVYS